MRQFAFLAVLALGCQQEPRLGSSQEDLTSVQYYSFGCAGNCGSTDLGTTTGRTCFIAGIRGNLAPTSSVFISSSGGHWWLNVSPNASNTLWADATCLSSATNRVGEFVQTGNGTTTIAAGATGTRKCYLTRVASNIGAQRAFLLDSDHVRVIKKADGTWDLTVSQQQFASATVGAMCVDVPTLVVAALEQAPDNSVVTDFVTADTINTACALRGVGGQFATNSSTDGARIEPLSATPDMAVGPHDMGSGTNGPGWWVEAHNGKSAWYACVN
jgi:hypothetical protein